MYILYIYVYELFCYVCPFWMCAYVYIYIWECVNAATAHIHSCTKTRACSNAGGVVVLVRLGRGMRAGRQSAPTAQHNANERAFSSESAALLLAVSQRERMLCGEYNMFYLDVCVCCCWLIIIWAKPHPSFGVSACAGVFRCSFGSVCGAFCLCRQESRFFVRCACTHKMRTGMYPVIQRHCVMLFTFAYEHNTTSANYAAYTQHIHPSARAT